MSPPRHGEGDRAQRGGGGSASLRRPETYTARRLRREMTLPETLLWKQIRGKRLGHKFRRQYPIGPYIADFYCSSARLVVEIDGQAHDNAIRSERDVNRDRFFAENGYSVLHIRAAEILSNMEEALQVIASRVESPLHQPSAGPPPRTGEDI
ncbi:endonuclease domain-containing protein [Parasphingopyxis sp.]|uniref:endonuclease domain-containing protein n=1 Tax=Parasphingopyxis sp. TaxID=1920299 RepID=UPI00260A0C0B|nr:endonuclease domain-containing protein [Parasphingopyxis sp.]